MTSEKHSHFCRKCGKTKNLDDFYKYNKATCKECLKEYKKKSKEKRRAEGYSRHEEYRRQAIKNGSMTRAGVTYIITAPIGILRWCVNCKKYVPIENFRKTKRKVSRVDSPPYRRTSCIKCENQKSREKGAERYVPHPRPKNDENPRVKLYLSGDGCCLYCGETDFWKLNNHHPWKKTDPYFTVTLCENHHTLCTRGVPFFLEDWY